jgi:hypothetical protein
MQRVAAVPPSQPDWKDVTPVFLFYFDASHLTQIGLKKHIGDPPFFLKPDNEPKPPPSPQPIRDPYGYMARFDTTMIAVHGTYHYRHDGHGEEDGLKAVLERFEIDLEEPVFVRMHMESLVG